MDISCGSIARCAIRAKFAFEGQAAALGKDDKAIVAASAKRKEFTGKAASAFMIRSPSGGTLLLGLGKKEEFEIDILRSAAGRAANVAREAGVETLGFEADGTLVGACGGEGAMAGALCEGAMLSLYRFVRYKQKDEDAKEGPSSIAIDAPGSREKITKAIRRARAVCEASAFARDIANESGMAASPNEIAKAVAKMARKEGISFRSLLASECRKMKMGAYLSVAAGSEKQPEFIVLKYRGKGARQKVCIVGKGVTFDSGGISLKPSKDMDKMKHDKCGAAAAFGAIMAAAKMRLPIEVVAIAPLVENMPSGGATKPGDIVRAMNGKTIEVQNTDAEGRLILADALCYAQKEKPSAIIDLATLTGACVVALGSNAAGLLGNSDELNARIIEAGNGAHERAWILPLWKEYSEQMKGEFSDLKNVSGDGEAGTITAASFLSNFAGDAPWAHIDIAGTAYSYRPKGYFTQVGSNGFGVRLLANLLEDWKALEPKKTGKK